MDPEEACLLKKLLPYNRDQALELSREVVKLLSKETAFKEDFDLDEEPYPQKKTGVESWLSAVSQNPQGVSWMKLSVELSGCLVRKAKTEVRFASKKGFSTQLATEPTPGWVLEQALTTRKESERACRALAATMKMNVDEPDYLLQLCERLDTATSALCRARNALLFPNPLGFPRSLRPFNGFSPPLSDEYLLDFSLFRDRLVIASYRLQRLSSETQPPFQAIVPDRWFDDPAPPQQPRLVGTTIVFEGGNVVRVLEQHSVTFQVALLTKIQVFLGDSHRVLRDLSMNVVACLSVRPDFFLSAVRSHHRVSNGQNQDDDIEDMESADERRRALIQPSRTAFPEPGKRWY